MERIDPTVPTIKAVVIMDSEGKRIAVKYFSEGWYVIVVFSLDRFLLYRFACFQAEASGLDPVTMIPFVCWCWKNDRCYPCRISMHFSDVRDVNRNNCDDNEQPSFFQFCFCHGLSFLYTTTIIGVVAIDDCREHSVPAQAEFEKNLFAKTSRTNARGEGKSVISPHTHTHTHTPT